MIEKINQKGAAAVEFAIVLPLLMVLLFGIIEFGFIFYNQQVITNASREGARAGIVSQNPRMTDSQLIQLVKNNYCGKLIPQKSCSVQTTAKNNPVFPIDDLTVSVTTDYQFIVLPDLLAAFFGGSSDTGIQLSASTLMKYE